MKGVNRIKCLDYFWELLKQYVRVVLFIKLDKVVLTMKSEAVQGCSSFSACSETLVCDHSKKRYWAVLSCGTGYYAVQGGSNF